MFVLHIVEPDLVNSDIRLFFKRSFLELGRRRRGLDGWPTEEQLDCLSERAAGLFVYAVATVKFIGDKNNDPKQQLNRILQSTNNTAYEGKTKFRPNMTLNLLYMTILQGAFEDDDPEDDRKVRSVLGAVTLAVNPLSPATIATILGLSTEDTFLRLSSVHSLLLLQTVDHPVRPYHKSFPDFIVDPARCTDKRFHVFPPDYHSELLIGCLELLNRKLEKNMCDLPNAVANDEVGDLRERAEQHIGHDLRYACSSWHKHFVDAHTAPAHTAKIISVLHQFLQGKFLFWLEVLSVLGAARDAVEALEAAAKWLEVCHVYTLGVFPKFTHIGSRHHQLLTSSVTVFDLSPDSSKS